MEDIMGYYITVSESKFKIKVENLESAFKACKEKLTGQYHWVDTEYTLNTNNIVEYLNEWRWCIEIEDGNIIDIEFDGEKLGDDEELFKVLAPFVESGSYIEISGEDGDLWRWVFKDGCLYYTSPTWPDIKDLSENDKL